MASDRNRIPRLSALAQADEICAALNATGVAIIERALAPHLLAAVNAAMNPHFACHQAEARTTRLSGVFAKAAETADVALHHAVLAAIERTLLNQGEAAQPCNAIQLDRTEATSTRPNAPAEPLQRDEDAFPFQKDGEIVVNAMWALDPCTVENGAPVVAPGSHRWFRGRKAQGDEIVMIAAPAGSAIVWLGSTLHGTAPHTGDTPRRALSFTFSVAWLAQTEKLLLSIPPHIARALPPKLQCLIGYQPHGPDLGLIEGRHPMEWLNGAAPQTAA